MRSLSGEYHRCTVMSTDLINGAARSVRMKDIQMISVSVFFSPRKRATGAANDLHVIGDSGRLLFC